MRRRSEPRELALARADLARSERRAAIRAVGRGQQLEDLRLARLGVALARDAIARSDNYPLQLLFQAIFGLCLLAVFAGSLIHHGISVGTVVFGMVDMLLWCGFVRGLRRVERWHQSEAANRTILEQAGQPFEEDLAPVPRPRPALTALVRDLAVQWLITDLVFGGLTRGWAGKLLTLAGIVRDGAIFATVMALWTLFETVVPGWRDWLRNRLRAWSSRQSEHDRR